MARRFYSAEQIINKLREAEVLIGQGIAVGQASRPRRRVLTSTAGLDAPLQDRLGTPSVPT